MMKRWVISTMLYDDDHLGGLGSLPDWAVAVRWDDGWVECVGHITDPGWRAMARSYSEKNWGYCLSPSDTDDWSCDLCRELGTFDGEESR